MRPGPGFVTRVLLALVLAASVGPAAAQPPETMPRVGYMSPGSSQGMGTTRAWSWIQMAIAWRLPRERTDG